MPVKRWAAAPQPSAGSDTHSWSKPRSVNQAQIRRSVRHGDLPSERRVAPVQTVARVVGPIPRHLDATGILLEMVTAGY